ncbi:MAG: DUF6111 family protein [Pseudomonadota bacterium]
MATRILVQLILFLLPFALFGLYRMALVEAQEEGRKAWPIRWLFGIGLVLAIGSWIILIFLNQGGREECYRESRMENGVIVPGESYPCDKDFSTIGIPNSDDPGGQAEGIGDPDPAGPDDRRTDTP